MGAQHAGWDTTAEQHKAAPPPLDLQQLLAQTDIPLFRGLSKRHLRRVARLAELRQYVGSKPIVHAGSRGDSFYIVLDGSAEVRRAEAATRVPPAGRLLRRTGAARRRAPVRDSLGGGRAHGGAHRAGRLPQALARGAGDRRRPAAGPRRHRAGLAAGVGPAAHLSRPWRSWAVVSRPRGCRLDVSDGLASPRSGSMNPRIVRSPRRED